MYHSVSDAPAASTRALSVRPAMFGAQLRYLRKQGFSGLTFGELCQRRRSGQPLPARPIVLTFDDGYADLIEEALPIMIEQGFPATVFVTTGWLRDAARYAAGTPLDRMLSWGQLAELSSAGVEIAAHSHSHPQLDQISEPRLRVELAGSRRLLEDRLGHPVCSLAYPYGYSSKRVRAVAREIGYLQAAVVANAVSRVCLRPLWRASPHHPPLNLAGRVRPGCASTADTASLRPRSRAHRRDGPWCGERDRRCEL